jgi:hypothetical protein
MSAMSCLRPETCAKLASSLASCLAVACENMANQDRCGWGSHSCSRGSAGRLTCRTACTHVHIKQRSWHALHKLSPCLNVYSFGAFVQ